MHSHHSRKRPQIGRARHLRGLVALMSLGVASQACIAGQRSAEFGKLGDLRTCNSDPISWAEVHQLPHVATDKDMILAWGCRKSALILCQSGGFFQEPKCSESKADAAADAVECDRDKVTTTVDTEGIFDVKYSNPKGDSDKVPLAALEWSIEKVRFRGKAAFSLNRTFDKIVLRPQEAQPSARITRTLEAFSFAKNSESTLGMDAVYYVQGCQKSAFILCRVGWPCHKLRSGAWSAAEPRVAAAEAFAQERGPAEQCSMSEIKVKALPEDEYAVEACGQRKRYLCMGGEPCIPLNTGSETSAASGG